MALTSALGTSFAGLRNTEAKINVVSSNVTNADKPGYTRKEIETNYVSVNGETVPLQATLTTVNYNLYLFESLIADTSLAALNSKISDFLSQYTAELGTIEGDTSISAYIDEFSAALAKLSATPEDSSLKSNVVDQAEIVARELNRLSQSIQSYRLQVDQEIERSVTTINESLERIDNINTQVRQSFVSGQSTVNLEDDRRVELERLANLIEIDYFINNNNEVQIYSSGRPLLDSRAHEITYTANTNLDSNTIYPAGFNPIALDGFDITEITSSGELGALINLRDSAFVSEQAKIDEFTAVLMTEVNRAANQGSSLPARTSLLGDVIGVAGADALAATGNVRIATVDSDGVLQNGADFNLAGYPTVAAMIADINATLGPDVTVNIALPDGRLQIVANNAGEGIAINELDSSVGADNLGMSHYFGLNNVFTGTGADDIVVSDYLTTNPDFFAAGRLSDSGALAPGALAIAPGDSSTASTIKNALTTNYSFNAAGDFSAQTESINKYMNKIIANAAYSAENASDNARITTSLMEETKSSLENLSGVNIDEELAYLIDLEAKYEASATMLATIQDLFDTLLSAVR